MRHKAQTKKERDNMTGNYYENNRNADCKICGTELMELRFGSEGDYSWKMVCPIHGSGKEVF